MNKEDKELKKEEVIKKAEEEKEAILVKKMEDDKKTEAAKKKAAEIEASVITKDQDSSEFLVYMHDTFGSSVRDTEPIKVNRAIQGGNVWLINDKLGFKEPIPENTDDYKNYKLEELNEKIKELENKRVTVLKKKIADRKISLRDLDQELIVFRGWKRSILLKEEGSYLNISRKTDGRLPYFRFLRKGNFKLPMFTGIETGLIRVPNEFNIREAGDLLKENEEKNNTDKFLNIFKYTMLILMLLAFIAQVYFLVNTANVVQTCGEVMLNVSSAFTGVADGSKLNTELLQQLVNNSVVPDSQVNVVPNVVNR